MRCLQTATVVLLCAFMAVMPALHVSAEDGEEIALVKLRPDVRAAIDKGLRHIASQQRDDGNFGYRDTHQTAVALMAFMLQGHIPGQGEYGEAMEKGISFLIGKAEEQDGFLGSGTHQAGMYEHGLAVLALSEAWGQSKNPKLGKALRDAVDVTLSAQNEAGGWRYAPRPSGADVSMTAMHVVALNSAREAGIAVPQESIDRAAEYVISCQVEESGGFSYEAKGGKPSGTAAFPRSGAGTLALILSGKRDHHTVRRGMAYLKDYDASKFTYQDSRFFYYAHYYAIQCMYQSGEEDFKAWYPKVLQTLLEAQEDDGSWGNYGNRGSVYSTGMAILIAGVPYRYLPIYQR